MNRSRRITTISFIPVLVLALAACSSGSSPSAAVSSSAAASQATASDAPSEGGEEAEVRLVSSTFGPGELTVSVNTTVVFINDDSFDHTISEGTDGEAVDNPLVDDEIAGNGGEVRVTFNEAGTYDITCRIHPSMQMTVTVEG